MSSTLRTTLIIGIIFYFIIILYLLKKKSIRLGYTLLWVFSGIILLAFVIWPDALFGLCELIGIVSAINGLFLIWIALIISILMSITGIISKQSEKIKNLTQTIGRMERRIRELENEHVVSENNNKVE